MGKSFDGIFLELEKYCVKAILINASSTTQSVEEYYFNLYIIFFPLDILIK